MNAISLFSNCGAGDFGYKQAGFQFKVMAELKEFRLDVALLNHSNTCGVAGDLQETWTVVVDKYQENFSSESLELLAACPPCQGMSTNNSGRGKASDADAGSRDERNLLVGVIVKVANTLSPRAIVVENVPAFLTRKVRHPQTGLPVSAADWLISSLSKEYIAYPVVIDLQHYGVPQKRKRTFITLLKRNLPIVRWLLENEVTPYPLPTHDPTNENQKPITLQSALQNFGLPSLDARTEKAAYTTKDFTNSELHFVPVWNKKQYSMIAAIEPNTGMSAWENKKCLHCNTEADNDEDAICSVCQTPLPRPVMQKEDGTYRLVKGYRSSSYRRMSSDEPAATITTATGHIGSSRTIHPFENRVFSPLECALIQTIPQSYCWGNALNEVGHTNIRAMIGEAVPPRFTKLHGEVLFQLLMGEKPENLLPHDDYRCKRARDKLSVE